MFLVNALMLFISTLSMFGSMFVATMIFSSKKLQVHPQRLIAYTCLSEAISSFNGVIWAMGTEFIIDYLDLDTVLARSVLFNNASKEEAKVILIYANDFCFQYFSILTLALNTCLCIDLVLTLKNPFQPAKTRMMIYLGASGIICIPLAFLTLASIKICKLNYI